MSEEIINSFAVLAYMGFKIVTIGGEDLTGDLQNVNPPIFDEKGDKK